MSKPENLKTPLDFEIRGRYDYCNGGTIDRFVEATAKTKGKQFLDRYYLGFENGMFEGCSGFVEDLDEKVEKRGDKFVYVDKKGKVRGTHSTRAGAEKQATEIKISRAMGESLDGKKKRKKKKKKAKVKVKRDACYHKVKARYSVWPSAYASGALVKCRKVGAANWGNKSKKRNESMNEEFEKHDMFDPKTGEKFVAKVEQDHEDMAKKGYVHVDPKKIEKILRDEGGASGMDPFLKEFGEGMEDEIKKALEAMPSVAQHKDGDYILDDNKDVDLQEVVPTRGVYAVGQRDIDNAKRIEGMYRKAGLTRKADRFKEAIDLALAGELNIMQFNKMLDSVKNVTEIKVTTEQLTAIIEEEVIAVLNERKKKRKKAGSESSKESSLRDWFGRKGAKGKKSGWVDCNAPDGKGGYKACGRSSGEKRKRYPACRPTPGACKERGRGKSWGKKSAKRKKNEGLEMRKGFMFEGDDSILEHFHNATLEEGGLACGACLFEVLQEASCGCPDLQQEAEYRGRKVKLNKVMRGDVKKFKVFVKDPKTGNIKKVNFGHGGTSAKKRGEKTMKIKKSDPERRKSFRARHNCDNPGPKTKARYWSCRMWEE